MGKRWHQAGFDVTVLKKEQEINSIRRRKGNEQYTSVHFPLGKSCEFVLRLQRRWFYRWATGPGSSQASPTSRSCGDNVNWGRGTFTGVESQKPSSACGDRPMLVGSFVGGFGTTTIIRAIIRVNIFTGYQNHFLSLGTLTLESSSSWLLATKMETRKRCRVEGILIRVLRIGIGTSHYRRRERRDHGQLKNLSKIVQGHYNSL